MTGFLSKIKTIKTDVPLLAVTVLVAAIGFMGWLEARKLPDALAERLSTGALPDTPLLAFTQYRGDLPRVEGFPGCTEVVSYAICGGSEVVPKPRWTVRCTQGTKAVRPVFAEVRSEDQEDKLSYAYAPITDPSLPKAPQDPGPKVSEGVELAKKGSHVNAVDPGTLAFGLSTLKQNAIICGRIWYCLEAAPTRARATTPAGRTARPEVGPTSTPLLPPAPELRFASEESSRLPVEDQSTQPTVRDICYPVMQVVTWAALVSVGALLVALPFAIAAKNP